MTVVVIIVNIIGIGIKVLCLIIVELDVKPGTFYYQKENCNNPYIKPRYGGVANGRQTRSSADMEDPFVIMVMYIKTSRGINLNFTKLLGELRSGSVDNACPGVHDAPALVELQMVV